LAFDRIAAVARVPLEGVVAGTQEDHIVALLAVDEVVVVAAPEQVDSVAAQQRVFARATVRRDLNERGEIARASQRVVAAVGVLELPPMSIMPRELVPGSLPAANIRIPSKSKLQPSSSVAQIAQRV